MFILIFIFYFLKNEKYKVKHLNKNSRKRMDNQKKQYQIKLFEHFIITCIYFFFKGGLKNIGQLN